MTQQYRDILGSDFLSESRGHLNEIHATLRDFFSGPTAPPNPVANQFWGDTTSGRLWQRDPDNASWIEVGRLGQSYWGALPRSGGTMTGPIAMGGHAITGIGLGSGTAAARQQEVDLKAPIDSPEFTGDPTCVGVTNPASSNSLIRRGWAESQFVPLVGGTMTGPLVLHGAAAIDTAQAVPINQLQAFRDFDVVGGHRHEGGDARRIRAADLDAGTAAANHILRSQGNGTVAWGSLAAAGRFGIFVEPVMLFEADNAARGWTTLTLSAPTFPVDIHVVFLSLRFIRGGSDTVHLDVDLRESGTDPAEPQTFPGEAVYATTTMLLALNQRFDYRVRRTGSLSYDAGAVRCCAIGYSRYQI